jgi:hypothetical protein
MLTGVPERQTFDYARHGTTSLFAPLEVATGVFFRVGLLNAWVAKSRRDNDAPKCMPVVIGWFGLCGVPPGPSPVDKRIIQVNGRAAHTRQ